MSNASKISIFIEVLAYGALAFIAILVFGQNKLKSDLMENLASRPGALSITLRIVFCFLLMFNVPFKFFTAKQQSLVLHDEIVNHSMSKQIDKSIQSPSCKRTAAACQRQEEGELAYF